MLRAVQLASPDHADELYKELLDFWLKAAIQADGELKFDEQTLRDAFMRKMKLTARARAAANLDAPIETTHMPAYSGSGLPLVSGANGRASRPTRNTEHIVIPA